MLLQGAVVARYVIWDVCLQAELVEAQAIAEEKARELAVANGLVAEKTRQYAEVQRLATESEQQAAALEDKAKMQLLETKQERYAHPPAFHSACQLVMV